MAEDGDGAAPPFLEIVSGASQCGRSNSRALCVCVSLRSHQPRLRRGGLVADSKQSPPVPLAAASRRPAARPPSAGLLGD